MAEEHWKTGSFALDAAQKPPQYEYQGFSTSVIKVSDVEHDLNVDISNLFN